jgi:hypothetical protein
MLVANDIEEGHQDMKAGAKSPAVAPESLDHVCALLRHDDRGFGHDENDEERQDYDDDESAHKISVLSRFGAHE